MFDLRFKKSVCDKRDAKCLDRVTATEGECFLKLDFQFLCGHKHKGRFRHLLFLFAFYEDTAPAFAPVGGLNITDTARHPQRGHRRRSARCANGKSLPRTDQCFHVEFGAVLAASLPLQSFAAIV
jgi:hypothetical protein